MYLEINTTLCVYYISMEKRYIRKEPAIKVGENIKAARRAKGLTQKEVADKMNTNQQQYSRYETGVHELSYQQIKDLCSIIDITPNEMFDFD